MENEPKIEDVAKAPTMVESAHAAAERLEKANSEMRANIARLEELKSFEALGGKSEGAPQQKTVEQVNPIDYARMALAGKLPPKI